MEREQNTLFIKNINEKVKNILKKSGLEHIFDKTNHLICDISIDDKNMLNIKCKDVTKICTYEHLGTFDVPTKTWYWAWGYYVNNEKTLLSKKITSNIKKMMTDDKLNQIDIEYLNFFVQNSIYMSSSNLNSLIKICMVASDGKAVLILPSVIKQNDVRTKINFYIITKIIQTENN